VPEAIALVTVDVRAGAPAQEGLGPLAAAFREAGVPVVHAVGGDLAPELLPATATALDLELLRAGGVQTLGPSEMAIGLPGARAFEGTPLDALLRALVIETVVVGGSLSSAAITVRDAEVRGFRALLATEELAVILGANLTAA
jgi:nicotinamidase-related amidase